MKSYNFVKILAILFLMFFFSTQVLAEEFPTEFATLVDYLPDAENAKNRAVLINNQGELSKAFPENKIVEAVNFTGGTQAVTADYGESRVLIIEFMTPQFSIDADSEFQKKLLENPQNRPVFYRRIGNFSAFVFNSPDEQTANNLLNQIKYEKYVQWLREDPFFADKVKRAEQIHLRTASDILLSTALAIVSTLGTTLLIGAICGWLIFLYRKKQKASMTAFSDAGGMTRLNLDQLSEPIQDKLLKG